jgi:hypothetical protein
MPMATAEIQEAPDQAEALASRDPRELRADNAVNGGLHAGDPLAAATSSLPPV